MSLPLNSSSKWVTDGTMPRPRAGFALVLLLSALLTATFAVAAPEYALSGRAMDLDAVEIARTDYGILTALDLLIFDDISGQNALAGIPMDVWLDLGTQASGESKYLIESVATNMVATCNLAEKAGAWQPDPQKVRVMTFNAAIATWIQNQVVPQVKVVDADVQRYYLAHAEKYLERQRLQVRYIFRAADPDDVAETARIRAELEQVAFDVREKRIAFEEAAKQFSEAPSASQGGLLPPFYDGTYFDEFDTQAFNLTGPGDLSRVFDGPEGLYLLQLEKIWPLSNIPIEAVHEDIATQLKNDHVRHYYAYLYKKLSRKSHEDSRAGMWNYMNLDAPVAYVGDVALTRNQFLRYYDNPTDEQFGVRWNVVFMGIANWIEGETIMQDLARSGKDASPWIVRAEEIALAILRGRHVLSTDVPPEIYQDAMASIETLQSQPYFTGMLRQCRLVEFEYVPQDRRDMGAADKRAAERLATQVDEQLARGILSTDPNPIDLTQWASALGDGSTAALKAPLAELRREVAETGWTNLTFNVRDFGWVNSYPGSSWDSLIGSRPVGSVSDAYRMGSQIRRYLLIGERPIAPGTIKDNAMLVRQLAHDMAGYGIFLKEVDRVREKGVIKFNYPAINRSERAPESDKKPEA